MWRGDNPPDPATGHLVAGLQRLLEWCQTLPPTPSFLPFPLTCVLAACLGARRLVAKGFERTEEGFLCPPWLPTRRESPLSATSGGGGGVVCRLHAFARGGRLGFYCSAFPGLSPTGSLLHNQQPEPQGTLARPPAHSLLSLISIAINQLARAANGDVRDERRPSRRKRARWDDEHDHQRGNHEREADVERGPQRTFPSNVLAEVLIDQLGFDASPSDEFASSSSPVPSTIHFSQHSR